MDATTVTAATMTDAQKTERIKAVVIKAGQDLREQYPILKRQDLIGASILVFSLLGMVATGALYYYDLLAWWICIPVAAIFASFTHELEHDLIHLMYFRQKKWANDLMMALVWLARPSTGSPWVRRRLHLHHHKFSGTNSDLEEQAITNGEPWGLRRLIMTGDLGLATILRPLRMIRITRRYVMAQNVKTVAERKKIARELMLNFFPMTFLYQGLMLSFLGYHAVTLGSQALGDPMAWSATVTAAMPVINFLAVVWLLPNTLRTFCLHFISSNMHYYGDVEANNVMQQCQVLNVWWSLPFQLFCFNFGNTHAIHHFVVKEPFYIRQMTQKPAHRIMREMGVRFNDIPSIGRANRWNAAPVMNTATPAKTATA